MTTKPNTILGIRFSALLELVLMLGIFLIADIGFMSNNRFWEVNPHPFWLVVLLLACKYGTKEGVLAAIACTAALLIHNLPPQNINQDSYSYLLMVLKNPLLWLIAGVGFGELRQMHIRERDELREEVVDSREREETISRSYEWVKQLKERLELRVAGQLRSAIASYQAARALETLSPGEVLQGLEQLMMAVMHPEKFSVYTITDQGLELALTHGWNEKDSYTRSFDPRSALYQSVMSGTMLCVVNADQERILGGQAILAGPMVDRDTGEIVGMLKIESLGFADLNISSIESFNAICEWAGMAIVNARKYQLAKSESMINPDHNLLSYNYFRRYTDYITNLGRRVGFDVTMLIVRLSNPDQLSPDVRGKIARLLAESTDRVLRSVDLAFDYQKTSEEFSIVLPATPRPGAQIVLDKIRTDLLLSARAVSREAEFTFAVQAIYEK